MMRALIAVCTLALSAAPALATCGIGEPACSVPLGDYYVAMPEGPGPHPGVIFIHGYGSSGESSLRVGAPMRERGYAVIGPQGLRRDGDEGPTTWGFHPEFPRTRDEFAFLREVLQDAVENHNVDPERVLLTGYSIGGSMTSYFACADPGFARAYAPLAGAFWRPHPPIDGCAGPVDLFHTHGWVDRTVPLEGRPLGGGWIEQGDVFYAMRVWREVNDCAGLQPDSSDVGDLYWRRSWETCAEGSLEFALHPGGHGIPKGWANMVIDWFETLPEATIR